MTPTTPLRSWFNLTALILGACAFAFNLHAQTAGTGTVQGRVYNPASKEYVRNAEVRLEGTEQVTYTENDGSFQFTGVPAGNVAVSVTYSGYNSAREAFTVTAGQTAVR